MHTYLETTHVTHQLNLTTKLTYLTHTSMSDLRMLIHDQYISHYISLLLLFEQMLIINDLPWLYYIKNYKRRSLKEVIFWCASF